MRDLRLELFDNGTVLRLRDADGKVLGRRQLSEGEIDALVQRVVGAYEARAPDLRSLGRELYDWVDGPGERWLASSLEPLRRDGLSLRVDVEARLRHLPWELLAHDGGFLCADIGRPLAPVRQVSPHGEPWERANRPLRVLFMAASPLDVEPVLHYEAEEQRILDAAGRSGIELVVEESGSLDGLKDRLRDHDAGWYDVVHLTGHADLSGLLGPILLLEDEYGELDRVSAERLVQAIEGRWPRLLFVSGCRTAAAGTAGLVPSFAERLVQAGAPCVMGWGHPVGDEAATVLAASLYEQLGAGVRVDLSVARARARLLEAESSYWHLLRAYADGSPLGPLVTPIGEPRRARLRVRKAELDFLDPSNPSKTKVCPASAFVGRRRALQMGLRLLKTLDQTADGYHEGLVLHGMGGLGKSSLAARLCSRLPSHRRLVWSGVVDEAELLPVVADRLGGKAARIVNEPGRELRDRLRILLEQIDDPLLFVFDNFEDNLEADSSGAPRLGTDDRARVSAPALAALGAVLWAIRESMSPSRVIVTCRYRFTSPAGSATLAELGLEGLAGADLTKKASGLAALSSRAVPRQLRDRALSVSDGNPRLLEWCDRALALPGVDTDTMLAALEGVAAEFREHVLVEALLAQQTEQCRIALARLAVCFLPVDAAAVEAIAGGIEPCMDRAISAGLVESGRDARAGTERYRVPDVVRELLHAPLTDSERQDYAETALVHLYGTWWERSAGVDEPRALELHRLAIAAGDTPRLAHIADALTQQWIGRARFREAAALCELTLAATDDYRVRHSLARAQETLGETVSAVANYQAALTVCPTEDELVRPAILHNLAGIRVQQGEIKVALGLYEQSLAIKEQIGDARGKAATLHAMANVRVQQGEIKVALGLYEQSLAINEQIGDARGRAATLHAMANVRVQQGEIKVALGLYEESLAIEEQIGDARGRAATLHEMANVRVQQGEIKVALGLYEQSLAIKEQIGDAQGKAATLANMAHVHAGEGDEPRASPLLRQAATLLATSRAWPDLVTVLGNLGALMVTDERVAVLAQSAWLATVANPGLETRVYTTLYLARTLGVEHDAAPWLAAFALAALGRHPEPPEPPAGAAARMMDACLNARSVPPDQAGAWLVQQGLADVEHLTAGVRARTAALVPIDAWLFDRTGLDQS